MNLILIGIAISLVLSLFLGRKVDVKAFLKSYTEDKNKELANVKNSVKLETLTLEEKDLESKKPADVSSDEVLKYFNKK